MGTLESIAQPRLDEIDRRILDLLQANARMSNAAVAREVGLTPPATLERTRRLEAAGIIRGYHADIDASALGFGVTVYAHVGLHSQAETDLVAFEALINSWAEVRECHMLAGLTDFLLKIVAVDWDAYQRFLTSRLTAAPNVSVVKSALAIRSSTHRPGVPIDTDEPAPPR